MKKGFLTAGSTGLVGVAALTASLGLSGWMVGQADARTPDPITQPAGAALSPEARAAIPDVVERVLPSVVSISSTRVSKPPAMLNDPMFRRFFGQGGEAPPERREQGLGSGVVIAPGIVVTNHHVVDGAQEIRVTAAGDRDFEAKIVGSDPQTDLAVLRLAGDTSALRPIEIGDSSRLRLGESVIAIGNPFGVGQTVTVGIVSAKGRADLGILDYEDFIQTDAAINPGNSGGALVNSQGQLVGINTAILSRSGGNVGIGFAIPTDLAKPVIEALQKHGKVSRGFLGIGIQDVNQELAQAMKLPDAHGVLVSDVQPGGPGAKAGLARGDVILSVNGKVTNTTGKLRNAVASAGSGSKAELEVLRNGKKRRLTVALAEAPAKSAASESAAPERGDALEGMALEPLTSELREQLGVERGVVVSRVDPNSRAARAGIRAGDVILEVEGTPVRDPASLRSAWAKSGKEALLLVMRGGATRFVVVPRG